MFCSRLQHKKKERNVFHFTPMPALQRPRAAGRQGGTPPQGTQRAFIAVRTLGAGASGTKAATPVQGSGSPVPCPMAWPRSMAAPVWVQANAPHGVSGRRRGRARQDAVIVVHRVQDMLKVYDQAPGCVQGGRARGRAAAWGHGANRHWLRVEFGNLGERCQRLPLHVGHSGTWALCCGGLHQLKINPSILELDGGGGWGVGRARGRRAGRLRWRRRSSNSRNDSSFIHATGRGIPR
jgi:hypothetical protein